MKYCPDCKTDKSLTEFHRCSAKRDGYDYRCIVCKKIAYEKKASVSKIIPPFKLCGICEKRKPSDEFNRSRGTNDGLCHHCISCRSKSWQNNIEENQKRVYDYRKTARGRAIALLSSAKKRALSNNLEFKISIDRVETALFVGECERTGVKFVLEKHTRYKNNPYSPSIDKVDAFGGYTNENIKIVCTAYNFGKMQMTHDEYVAFCKRVVEFNV